VLMWHYLWGKTNRPMYFEAGFTDSGDL